MTASSAISNSARRAHRLRVLVLVPKPFGISPSQRFRVEQWAPHLARTHGIDLTFSAFESPQLTEYLLHRGNIVRKAWWVMHDSIRRLGAIGRAADFDAIVVHREAALAGPAIVERLISWRRPVIYDFDDAIWLSLADSSANGIFSRLHFHGKTASLCALASAVAAGNPYLADYARRRNDNVFVVPTSIELDKYPLRPEPEPDDPFIVCWTGSNSTLLHFEGARAALERFAQKRRLVVKVICNRPPDQPIRGAETRFVRWSEEDEAAEVAGCHVGIMPLPDDAFARGKCGLKALQYMATGRPVIASPVGVNSEIIANGVNGLLAGSDDEWVAALDRLAASADLRRSLGTAARETVEQRYAAEVAADQFAEVIRSALAAR
jgi:glycosyltransferase involved in cell wall biosynthesis